MRKIYKDLFIRNSSLVKDDKYEVWFWPRIAKKESNSCFHSTHIVKFPQLCDDSNVSKWPLIGSKLLGAWNSNYSFLHIFTIIFLILSQDQKLRIDLSAMVILFLISKTHDLWSDEFSWVFKYLYHTSNHQGHLLIIFKFLQKVITVHRKVFQNILSNIGNIVFLLVHLLC